MNALKVKIVNKSQWPDPAYATEASAGMDLRADITEPIVLKPLERVLVPTGIFIELPVGYEAQVRPRSGLATKRGITVINSPGTVDADFRGGAQDLSGESFQRAVRDCAGREDRADCRSPSRACRVGGCRGAFGDRARCRRLGQHRKEIILGAGGRLLAEFELSNGHTETLRGIQGMWPCDDGQPRHQRRGVVLRLEG